MESNNRRFYNSGTEGCRGNLHTIQQGDTLYNLSRKYNVPLAAIMESNPNVNIYNLQIGSTLCIPTQKVAQSTQQPVVQQPNVMPGKKEQGTQPTMPYKPMDKGMGNKKKEIPVQYVCPECPTQQPCPTCPQQKECPVQQPCPQQKECPVQQPCPTCPPQRECPVQKPCPTCPPQKECPVQQPCPTCPPQRPCPECPTCPTCPVCPVCESCPTCPPQRECPVCPTCPPQRECPVCKQREMQTNIIFIQPEEKEVQRPEYRSRCEYRRQSCARSYDGFEQERMWGEQPRNDRREDNCNDRREERRAMHEEHCNDRREERRAMQEHCNDRREERHAMHEEHCNDRREERRAMHEEHCNDRREERHNAMHEEHCEARHEGHCHERHCHERQQGEHKETGHCKCGNQGCGCCKGLCGCCGCKECGQKVAFDTDYRDYFRHAKLNYFTQAKMPEMPMQKELMDTKQEVTNDMALIHYVVKNDETLQDVLEFFSMSFTEFMECNHTSEISLCPGRRVRVRNNRYMD